MRIVDWLARTAMLVLAALATLALIGSLASVSNTPIGAAFPGEIADISDVPAEEDTGAPTADPRVAASDPGRADAPPMAQTRTRIAAEREREVARWLKALTYAVIALAAVAAAGVVALVRIGSHVARMADR